MEYAYLLKGDMPVATSRKAKTLVLFGKVGNGKSAVGNSIIGKEEFVSRLCASGVTTTCKLETTTLDDGEVVNVIDTPGIFESSRGPEYYTNEIVKGIKLAEDGIDGFILVCSIRARFTAEEECVLHTLREIFGKEMIDYMIVVFTGGDVLDTTIEEYLSQSQCPPSLKRVLDLCRYRVVLFDNKTKDEIQRKLQIQQLMSYINTVMDENNGQSYKGDAFEMIKKEEEEDRKEVLKDMSYGPPWNQLGTLGFQQNSYTVHRSVNYDNHVTTSYGLGGFSGTLPVEGLREKLKRELDEAQKNYQDFEKEELERGIQMSKSQSAANRRGENILDFIYRLIENKCTIM